MYYCKVDTLVFLFLQRKDYYRHFMVNNEIRAEYVIVVSDNGKQQLHIRDAIKLAEANGLDLVAMNNDVIPVCKLMDYKKHLYEQKRKKKESIKKQRMNEIGYKEVQFTHGIQKHDLLIKVRCADRLLEKNNRVKITMKFRGRDIANIRKGIDILNEFELAIGVKHKVEVKPKITDRYVSMVLAP